MWSVNLDKFKEKEERIYNAYFLKGNNKRYEFITFHQSFTYEDFIEGIKPNIKDGNVGYCIEDGILKRLCREASKFPHQRYALFIDEINRGNISEIFGEVISLIESDKRKGEKNELRVTLPYSKEEFAIPNNVDIYGTMNSCDKSIANIDIALRRRFEFIRLKSESDIIKNVLSNIGIDSNNVDGIDVVKLLETINNRIELLLDDNYQIGHAYFTNVKKFEDIKDIIVKKIVPLLEEYFFDDLEKVQIVLNDLTEDGDLDDNAIYCHEILESSSLIRYLPDNIIDDKKRFYINEKIEPNSIIKIYE
nr:AAA family ATPase [Clostridium saudiense]